MNRLFQRSVCLALLLAFSPPCAWAAAGDEEVTVTTDFAYATSYIFRGLQRAHHSLQSAVTVTHGGFNGGVWANVPTDRGEAHEIDPFLFYSFAASGLSWDTGLLVYTYPEASDIGTSHTCELSLGATAPLAIVTGVPVNAGAIVSYDLRLARLNIEATVEHAEEFTFATRPAEWSLGVFAGCNDGRNLTPEDPGPQYRDAYLYYGFKLALSCKLSGRAAFKLTGQWDDARNVDPGQGHSGNLSGIAMLSWVW
ncbi:MAG: hypothetical protein PHQ04_00635 [Opitutaceae bacterium]|nr:hypothetical protein [Opitutaceae bacterium]